MPISNHAALGEGLRLYTAGMRRLIHDKLWAAYNNRWWDEGVLKALSDAQRNNVKRNAEHASGKDRVEHVDATHAAAIVRRHFDGALKGTFRDYKQTSAWLDQAGAARDQWAHPRSSDMEAGDVAHTLYAMVQILRMAGSPEATQVEKLRTEVLGLEQTTEAVREIRPAGAGELPYWWQVCEPHDGFKNPANIDESLFAATLGAVHAGAARREYQDPTVFFSHTYFTENLKLTLRDVASRLSGGSGPSVTEMQTPFGGGKTHALLTLYHLIQSPKESLAVPRVREALGDLQVPAGARVLVFDGNEAGTEPSMKEDTSTVSTLWGELAYQAGPRLFRELIQGTDERGEAPGNALYRQVLEAAAPCLILIDELVSYLVKLKFATSTRTRNLYRQTVQFMQEMLQLAGNVRGVCVLISLPKSTAEFGGIDPQRLQQELSVVADLQPRADRVVSKRTPVADDEIYTLVSRRLFKTADPSAAARVARMYRETYERTRALYDPAVFSDDYVIQQMAAYPLHPELIDVLYKKWSAVGEFPRTRTVLQLLASIVADQWVNRRDAYAIQSAHVNLERERVKTKIISAAGQPGWDAIIAADIIGGEAHADGLDEKRGGEYQGYHVARGVATTLLMHSFGGAARLGALPSDLRLGTVAPNVGPEYVSEILETLEQSLWYVHREGDLLKFQTRPNVYRMIARSAEEQSGMAVTERLRETLGRVIDGAEGFRVLEWAGAEGQIADRPEPTVAVLEPGYAVGAQDGDRPTGAERIEQLWDRVGGGRRQWRNALLLVAPDADLWTRAEEAMREVMAYDSVIATVERRANPSFDVSTAELRDLKTRGKEKQESLRTSLVTAYAWVFYPDAAGTLTALKLPVPALKNETVAKRAVERLSDQNYGGVKVLRKMGAVYFNAKIAPQLWKDQEAPLDLQEMARRFQEWTYLPILPDRERTLATCIGEGIGQGLWRVAIGDPGAGAFQQLIETPAALDAVVSLFDGSAWLIKGAYVELVREQLGVDDRQGEAAPTATLSSTDDETVITSRGSAPIPRPAQRFSRVRLRVDDLRIGKTSNLQPYLFKVLQEQDAAAELTLTIDVRTSAGISEEVIERRIVEAFEQLGVDVKWEPA